MSACTSWKAPENRIVDFSTRLFIRLDKINIDLTPEIQHTAHVSLTGLTPGRTKVCFAKGEVITKTDGAHKVELEVEGKTEDKGWVEL